MLIEEKNKAEVEDILKFLASCNNIYNSIFKDIYVCFENLNLGKDDLIDFCFVWLNRNFLYTPHKLFESMQEVEIFEGEKSNFSKIKDGFGNEVDTKIRFRN